LTGKKILGLIKKSKGKQQVILIT